MSQQITPFDWSRMTIGDDPLAFYGEMGLRVLLIFVAGLILMKVLGKRARRELTSFDMLIIIALGSAVGDALFYPEVPVFHALAAVLGVVSLCWLIAKIAAHVRRFDTFIGGTPSLIIKDGEICKDEMYSESLTIGELFSMLRENGIEHTNQVRRCYLELSGEVSIFRKDEGVYEGVGESTIPPLNMR